MSDDEAASPAVGSCRCQHCGSDAELKDDGALRCACGSLLARYFGKKLELKCRRCKRTVMVPLERDAG